MAAAYQLWACFRLGIQLERCSRCSRCCRRRHHRHHHRHRQHHRLLSQIYFIMGTRIRRIKMRWNPLIQVRTFMRRYSMLGMWYRIVKVVVVVVISHVAYNHWAAITNELLTFLNNIRFNIHSTQHHTTQHNITQYNTTQYNTLTLATYATVTATATAIATTTMTTMSILTGDMEIVSKSYKSLYLWMYL